MTAARASALPVQAGPGEGIDGVLLGLWLVLLGFGILAVSSASMELAASRFGDPWHHLLRHGIYLLVALAGFVVVLAIPTAFWRRIGAASYFVTIALLLIVLMPGLGREVNGALRWVALGPVSFQPSEAAKFLLVIYVAHYLARRQDDVRTSFMGMVRPLGWILIPATLLLAEPMLPDW